jgi:hypothetical protein
MLRIRMTLIDEYEYEHFSYCPVCIEPHAPMQITSTIIHYSCRFCGGWWSEKNDSEET